jgi:hypothetical protein
VYPLARAADTPPTTFIDAFSKDWDPLPYYDIPVFEDIHRQRTGATAHFGG